MKKIELHKLVPNSINLPYSKSILNRLLILNPSIAVEELNQELLNKDIEAMQLALCSLSKNEDIYIEEAGTVWRFMIALASVSPNYSGTIIAGAHLKTRPIEGLIKALQDLGADISITPKGFKINGKQLEGKGLHFNEQVSSQFITALMLISPKLKGETVFKINPKQSSYSYIELTIKVMRDCGFHIKQDGYYISISEQVNAANNIEIEFDASASIFYVALAIITPSVKFLLKGLKKDTTQAEKNLFEILENKDLVSFEENKDGVLIEGIESGHKNILLNFNSFPDAALNIILAIRLKGYQLDARGLESLNFKESKRFNFLLEQLKNLDTNYENDNGSLKIKPSPAPTLKTNKFNCESDHRVAMALALLATIKPIKIEGSDCVSKSYPYFWRELQKIGFNIE